MSLIIEKTTLSLYICKILDVLEQVKIYPETESFFYYLIFI